MPYAPLEIFTFYPSIIGLRCKSIPVGLWPLQAAAHIHRYLTLDESILLESSADSAKGDLYTNILSFSQHDFVVARVSNIYRCILNFDNTAVC